MYDAFVVNGNGSFIQNHKDIDKNVMAFIKAGQPMAQSQNSVICDAISHSTMQNIILLAVNRYLELSIRMTDYGDDIGSKLQDCLAALGKLYIALYPMEEDAMFGRLGGGNVPTCALNHAESAKRALNTITSNLSNITAKSDSTLLGDYQTYRRSKVENIKNGCNEFLYHLQNSIWNIRAGDALWSAMVGTAFNPKCWCLVLDNVVKNYDNTTVETDESFNPGNNGFYFKDPLDSWHIQNLIEISQLLDCESLLAINVGKRNCCGHDSYIIYSSANCNVPPLSTQHVRRNDANRPTIYYLKSSENGFEWTVAPA